MRISVFVKTNVTWPAVPLNFPKHQRDVSVSQGLHKIHKIRVHACVFLKGHLEAIGR